MMDQFYFLKMDTKCISTSSLFREKNLWLMFCSTRSDIVLDPYEKKGGAMDSYFLLL